MEVIKNLLIRFRQSGVLLLIGFFVIIYIAFGFVYLQQGSRQKELEGQITNVSLIVSKPLSSIEELQAEYDEANDALTSITDSDAIAILVGIAEKNGIDVDPDSDKFRIPSATISEEKVGGGTYKILSFKSIRVQGEYASVTAFLSDLDSGKTQETMVLRRVAVNQIELKGEGEEETRTETVATLDVDIYTKLGGDSL